MNDSTNNIGEYILQRLKKKKKTIVWLAQQINYDNSNLGKMLKKGNFIYYDFIFRISEAMNEDFFAYGSKKLKEKKKR